MADKDKPQGQPGFFDDVFSDEEMDALGARPEVKPSEPAAPNPAPEDPKAKTQVRKAATARRKDKPAGDDDEAGDCEPEECEPSEEDAEGGEATPSAKTGKSTKAAKKTTATGAPRPAELPSTFTYPFDVRYAANVLKLTGFVEGQVYTSDQVKDLLIQNGFTEFQDLQPLFHRNEETNTLVITIKGSVKGER